MAGRNIILGITGSIAAYKAIDIIKGLQQNSYEVTVVLSKTAPYFVPIMTLKSLCPKRVYNYQDAFDDNGSMLHITLAKSADLIVIAPTSANMISKLANAGGDCLLSNLCLATESKILLAPAMNKVMWENSLVRQNVEKLKNAGFHFIGPAYGLQACGDVGNGRMLEPLEVVDYCLNINTTQLLAGKKVVITAGATREKIDPIRFLSNHSSGKMGYALAEIASNMGGDVVLISGKTSLTTPRQVRVIEADSCEVMLKVAELETKNAHIFIGCAAVADYKPINYSEQKIKKGERMKLELVANPDIITRIKHLYPDIFCIGFAAETENIEQYGRVKLDAKDLDIIAINDVSNDKVFGKDFNELHVITRDNRYHFLKRADKKVISKQLLKIAAQYMP